MLCQARNQNLAPQMAECRTPAFRLGFDCKSGQTNEFNIGVHNFLACRSSLKDSVKNKPESSPVVPVEKGTYHDPPS